MINKLLKNEYFFSVLTKILMVVIAFIHSIILARFLGPYLKGTQATIYSIISIGSILINLSSHQAYPYFRKKYGFENYYDRYMTFIVIYHLIFIILSFMIAALVAKYSVVSAIAILLIPISGFSTSLGYVCLVEHPRARNTALLIIDIIDTIFIGFLWKVTEADVLHIFLVFLIPFLLKIIYFLFKDRFKFKIIGIDKNFVIEILKFSFFPMISMLLTTLNYKIDIFMLKASYYVNMTDIGIYSIGVSLADKVVYIPDAVKEILLSKLAKGKGEKEVALVMRFCFPVSCFITLVLIMIGEPIINILYGNEYKGAYLITLICVLGTSMMVFFKMISQYNNVNGKQVINVCLLCITIIINIILNIVMIPKFGINGAAIASLISYTTCAIIFLIFFKKATGIPIQQMIIPTKDDIKKIKLKLKK